MVIVMIYYNHRKKGERKMTVKELIKELEQIENKELDIVIHDDYNIQTTDIAVMQTIRYYGKSEDYGWVAKDRECVVLA